jgi:hypothetical protein
MGGRDTCVWVKLIEGKRGKRERDQVEYCIQRGGYYNKCYQHMMGEHGLNSSGSG